MQTRISRIRTNRLPKFPAGDSSLMKFAPVRLTRIARIVTNFIRLESPAGNFGSRLVRIREIRVCIFRLVEEVKNGHAIGGGIGSLAAGVYHHTVGVLSLRG